MAETVTMLVSMLEVGSSKLDLSCQNDLYSELRASSHELRYEFRKRQTNYVFLGVFTFRWTKNFFVLQIILGQAKA